MRPDPGRHCITLIGLLIAVMSVVGCGSADDVAGDTHAAPPVAATQDNTTGNSAPTITGTPPASTEGSSYYFAPLIRDADGDSLTLSASGLPAWVIFDPMTGTLTGTPGSGHIGIARDLMISVDDGLSTTTLQFDLLVEPAALEQALRTADHTLVSDDDIFLGAARATIAANGMQYASARRALFGLAADGSAIADSLTAISWDPSHDSALLSATFGENAPFLSSNDVTSESHTARVETLGIVGQQPETAGGARYLALGGNPMRNRYRDPASVNAQMDQLLRNGIAWLTNKSPGGDGGLRVVIAQMNQSYYFPDQVATRTWLDEQLGASVQYNLAGTCDGDALPTCLAAGPDLLVISQHLASDDNSEAITTAVVDAMSKGTPVLYMHLDGGLTDLGAALLAHLNVIHQADNYWHRLQVTMLDPRPTLDDRPDWVTKVDSLLARLAADSFSIDLSDCENHDCPAQSGYTEEFDAPMAQIQARIDAFDTNRIDIFADLDRRRLYKLLVLLADHYRQSVRFPMDKATTPRIDILRSLYADRIVHVRRGNNPAQIDMGNFSRADFTHIDPTQASVSLISTLGMRTSGVYALPGQPFTVTRTDNNPVATKIRINSIRVGSTHEFDNNGYTRPTRVSSSWIDISPGETVRLTTPYGGPVHVWFDNKGLTVDLQFSRIGRHPFWDGPEDTVEFEAALARDEFDWVEVVTPGFEVHAKADKMQQSINNPMWGSVAALADATSRYLQNYPHVLAGLRGPGIDVEPAVHDWASAHGLELKTLDTPKHMYADQASCGYGCSGNPYDAYWAYDPLGHGDLHELGHGLEQGRFRLGNWDGHASTNFYSYYTKYRYFLNTGDLAGTLGNCQSLPYQRLYGQLQASLTTADPAQAMRDLALNTWQDGAAIMIQIMASAQGAGILTDGWLMLARLHVVDREFNDAVTDDARWAAKATGLGFGGVSRAQAGTLSNNDWMLIALSHVLGRDMTGYLDMWGFQNGVTARAQVAGFGHPAMPRLFYALDATDHCTSLDRPALDMDAATPWP